LTRKSFLLTAASVPLLALRARAQSAIQIPFELLANGIYLPVLVDGKGPFPFAVDTGAFNSIVASEFVAELGIQTDGTGRASGEGSDSSPMATIDRLTFGLPQNVVVTTRQAGSVSLAALWPLIGRPFYGILGHDVLRGFVVRIDYANRILTLYDPAEYRYSGSGTTYAASLWSEYDPQIDGALVVAGVAPIGVKLTLDTGGGGTVVSTPVVDDHRLIESVGATIALPDHGIGNGQSRPLTARLKALEVGAYSLRAPLVALSQDAVGSFASQTISVDVGGNVLRRFTLILDYANGRVMLEPNRYFDEPFAADASGLVLAAEGADYRTFVVTEVVPDSPAAQAGLEPRDVITAIDSNAAASFALWQIVEQLERAGRTVALTIQRGAATFTRALPLRALI
jgi:hypothetical protein